MIKRGIRTESRLLVGFALICFVSASMDATAQTAPKTQEQLERLQQLVYSVKGPDLFRAHCAACHGEEAKGGGPLASALKSKVPDLTVLAKNNGGQFPSARVRRTIMGDEVLASHGSREMPIWGPIFHQIEEDVDWGNVRLENLVKYLESIQTVTASNTPSGAELYRQHCAVCHGNDLKGSGPAPYPFRAPPDLTTLARRNGGKFPDAYVSSVLQNGVVMPTHGPAEMPIWGTDFRVRGRLDETQVTLRIANLTNYIKSLQAK